MLLLVAGCDRESFGLIPDNTTKMGKKGVSSRGACLLCVFIVEVARSSCDTGFPSSIFTARDRPSALCFFLMCEGHTHCIAANNAWLDDALVRPLSFAVPP